MAIFQSEMAKRRETPPSGYVHGARMVSISTYTFTQDFTAATDILEIGLLPADTRLVGAKLIGENTGATNAILGVMDGEPGDPDATREIDDALFSATAINNAEVEADTLDCLDIAVSDKHRGIGVTLSANVTAGATKKLTLVLEYTH
jgi:hypothetical protein